MNLNDHAFHLLVTFTCGFLVLERLVRGALGYRRWIKRRAADKADAEYARIRQLDQPRWDELLS
jgi:hypothetical protein